jgi:hypothetical protein
MQYSKLKEFKFIQFTPSQLLSPRIPFRATKDYVSKLLVPEFTTKWKVEGKVITYPPPLTAVRYELNVEKDILVFLATLEDYVDLVLRLFYLATDHQIVINGSLFPIFSVRWLRGRRELFSTQPRIAEGHP